MSRALVLGGGGPVGIGWEAGLVTGLADGGVDLRQADLVIGTSAGSVVGAHLRLGTDLADYLKTLAEAAADGTADVPRTSDVPPGQVEGFVEALKAALAAPGDEEGRAVIGRFASGAATTITTERQMSFFADLAGRPWPDGFRCTTVETATGRFVMWDAEAGVDLQLGVATSCAVPGIFPAVEVAGKTYMDGAMRSSINADMAKGHDTVLVIAVVTFDLPPGLSDPTIGALAARQAAELDEVRRAGAAVDVIGPDQELLTLTMWGMNLMDSTLAGAAFDIGRRRGLAEAPGLLDRWG